MIETHLHNLITENLDESQGELNTFFQMVKAPIPDDSIFIIPGRGNHRSNCGTIRRVLRCKDSNEITIQRNWCMKKSCPVCYNAWASKQAKNIAQRMQVLRFKKNFASWYHWTVSPDQSFKEEDWSKFQKKISKVFGDCVIFVHPFRYTESRAEWRKGLHYHIISSTGFLSDEYRKKLEIEFKQKFTWKMIRKVKDNEYDETLTYELNHSGILKHNPFCHNVRYYGNLGTRKLGVYKMSMRLPVICKCKSCKSKLQRHRSFVNEVEHSIILESKENNHVDKCIKETYKDGKIEVRKLIQRVKIGKNLGKFYQKQSILLPKLAESQQYSYLYIWYPVFFVRDISPDHLRV